MIFEFFRPISRDTVLGIPARLSERLINFIVYDKNIASLNMQEES
jgi:hypothetical protein